MSGCAMDDRAYAECQTCCSGFSAILYRAEDWADKHESENPGHKVKVKQET